MSKRILFLVSITLVLVITIVLTTPLRFITDHIIRIDTTSISLLNGNVIKGKAQININALHIPNIDKISPIISSLHVLWDWCPLNGITAFCVVANTYSSQSDTQISLESIIQLSTDTVNLSDAHLTSQFTNLVLRDDQVSLTGNLNLRLDNAQFSQSHWMPINAKGRLSFEPLSADVKYLMFNKRITLDQLKVAVHTDQPSKLTIRLQGKGAAIDDINGNVVVTPKTYRYQLDVKSNDIIFNPLLQIIGKKSTDGYRLAGNGKW